VPTKKKTAVKAKPTKKWRLYVLLCKDGTLYCGITNDLLRRIAQHDAGKGARYTRGRGPVKLLRSWPQRSHSAALKAEFAFKRLTRSAKKALLAA
jgi:putative endonuclease